MNKEIFKAYDVRGIYPDEINENDIYKIAKAYCEFVKPKTVVHNKKRNVFIISRSRSRTRERTLVNLNFINLQCLI